MRNWKPFVRFLRRSAVVLLAFWSVALSPYAWSQDQNFPGSNPPLQNPPAVTDIKLIPPEAVVSIPSAQSSIGPATPTTVTKTIPGPEAKPVPSAIEKIMAGQFPTVISRDLPQFGYDFFNKTDPAFTPITNVPVGPDYLIGAGDSFVINLWGRAEGVFNAVVTRDGSIVLPRLGTLNVAGLTFAELKRYLQNKFKEYYPDFEMSVTMAGLRMVDIFVVGEVRNPGTYSVHSLSTVISALFSVGGPSKRGSLRNIQLSRSGQPPIRIDLYDFLIKGDKQKDLRLQPGDTIFVPVIGPVVGIAGCVKRPAVYELSGQETIADMIQLAGGILAVGHLQNVVVERVEGNQKRIIKSFNLEPEDPDIAANLKIRLKDFDLVKVYPVFNRIQQVVYLEGHVKYPREYELKPGMRLLDIIPSYQALLPEPYLPQAEIVRLMPPDLHPETLQFNLAALLAGDEKQNFFLQDLDHVIIYDQWAKKESPKVTVKGEVRAPGTYPLLKGMTVKDLIFQAGNLKNNTYMDKAELTRLVKTEKGMDILKISISLQSALQGGTPDNLSLEKDDVVHIRAMPQYAQALERKVYLQGEFVFPGEYSFAEGERLSAIIQRAGGLTREAYAFGAVFQRESIKVLQKEQLKEYVNKLEQDILSASALAADTSLDKEQATILQETLSSKKLLLEKLKNAESTGRMVINLEEVLYLPASNYNFELRPGDRLLIAKKPDYVNVMGEVYNPTALFAEKGKTVGHYLNLVGGTTDNADNGQIYVVKANGSVISKSQGGFWGMTSWDNRNNRWTMGRFDSLELDPGDTVIVPRKVQKYAWLRLTKDITEVIYKIAISAGVVKMVGLI